MDRVIQSREGTVSYVRDVGVAGSNPVTPTIDFNRIFTQRDNKNHHLVPDKIFFGPVLVPLSTLVECVSSRLSQCDALRPRGIHCATFIRASYRSAGRSCRA